MRIPDVSDKKTIFAASTFGYSGAIPFIVCAALTQWPISFVAADKALFALITYGALILSFLGGLHWGRAVCLFGPADAISQPSPAEMAGTKGLFWSVLPSLTGWCALLLPAKIGIILLLSFYLLALYFDLWHTQQPIWPIWMRRLRLHLSLTAMVCLMIGLQASLP